MVYNILHLMKTNSLRLLILLIFLLVLIGIFVGKNRITQYFAARRTPAFGALSANSVDKLDIRNNSQNTNLYKKGGAWFVTQDGIEYRADENKINTLIQNLHDLQIGETVSENKQKQGDYGIGPQKLTAYQGKKSYVLYVGNTAGLDANYVKLGDSNNIFVASGFTDTFASTDFRDLSVHFVNDESKVSRIELQHDGIDLTLVQKNADWYIGSQKAIRERVDFFTNDLKTLKAQNILKNSDRTLENPDLTITVKEQNTAKTAEFYKKDDTTYYMKTTVSPDLFEVAAADVSSFMKTESDFTK